MPLPNHAGVHLEVSRELPLNSSLKTRRQLPVWPIGIGWEDVAVGEVEVGVDVIVGVRVLVGVAVLVPVGSGVGDLVPVGSGVAAMVLVGSGSMAVGVGVLRHQRLLASIELALTNIYGK